MKVLKNRSAILVKAKAPLREWARQIRIIEEWPPEPNEPEDTFEGSLFLTEQIALENDLPELIELHWEEIFEFELSAWTHDEDLWPELEPETFEQWFDVQLFATVMDLPGGWIRRR